MDRQILHSAGRTVLAAVLLAALTAVAFHAWLGHGAHPRRHPDPLTGSATSAASGWALVGLIATLTVVAAVLVLRRWVPGWLPVLVVPPAVLVTASASMSGEDPFWAIAVGILTFTVVVTTGVGSLLTTAVRDARRPRDVPST